jgi:hypothetical protein
MVAFIPKKDDEGPLSVDNTRPLGLKNCDMKLIGGVINNLLAHVASCNIIAWQRGFVKGRNFLQNVIEIDTFSRQIDLERCFPGAISTPADIPILASFDIKAAFPSLLHEYLQQVLRHLRFPLGIVNGILAQYESVFAYGFFDGKLTPLFNVSRGIQQGCPMSASLFVIATHPLLLELEKVAGTPPRATFCYRDHIPLCQVWGACADDLGAIFAHAVLLVHAISKMLCTASFSGLHLNMAKTKLVLLGDVPPHVLTAFPGWLREFWPHLPDLLVVDTLKYLGFYLGPKSASKQWASEIAKFDRRMTRLAESPDSVRPMVLEYNTLIAPLISYKASLSALPIVFTRREQYGLQKLLKVPPNTFRRHELFRLAALGFPSFRCLEASAAASAASCVVRFPTYFALLSSLRGVAEIELPALSFFRGALCRACWDTPPIVAYLHTHAGFVGHLAPDAHIHSKVYKMVLDKLPDTLHTSVTCRMQTYGRFIDASMVARIFLAQLPLLGLYFRLGALKTALGGWHTDQRMMHTEVRGCLFGCASPAGRDALQHYLECRLLFHFFSAGVQAACAARHPGWLSLVQHDSVLFYGWAYGFYHRVRFALPSGDLYRYAAAYSMEYREQFTGLLASPREALRFWP